MGLGLIIVLLAALIAVVAYTNGVFAGWQWPGQVVMTTTDQQGRTVTITPQTTPPGGCPEAPGILSIPIDERSTGADYETRVRGEMGIFKDPARAVSFNHFGVTIVSDAIVYNHFDVEIQDFTGTATWSNIFIDLDVYGYIDGRPETWTVFGHADETTILLAMSDPWTTVFGYDLEENWYTLLLGCGGMVYGDGSTDTLILGTWLYVDLPAGPEWLDGGNWCEWGLRASNFAYCLDSSGVYDVDIEYYVPEWED